MSYYNTTTLQGQQLIDFGNAAINQDKLILSVFAANKGKGLTPFEVLSILENQGHSILITSVRRSISTLTKTEEIVKNGKEDQRDGKYKRPNCTWKYNIEKQNT